MANGTFRTRRRLPRRRAAASRPSQGQPLLPRLEDLSIDQIIALMRPEELRRAAAPPFAADDRAFADDQTDAGVPFGFPLAAPSTPLAAPGPLRSGAVSGLLSNVIFNDDPIFETQGVSNPPSASSVDQRRLGGVAPAVGLSFGSLAPTPPVRNPLRAPGDANSTLQEARLSEPTDRPDECRDISRTAQRLVRQLRELKDRHDRASTDAERKEIQEQARAPTLRVVELDRQFAAQCQRNRLLDEQQIRRMLESERQLKRLFRPIRPFQD